MNRKLIITEDGSHTISLPEQQVTYHSVHGAIQESMHVFIKTGLHYIIVQHKPGSINVFEMGFGTGLNAFLTAIEADSREIRINYTCIDNTPLTAAETAELNYPVLIGHKQLFRNIHAAPWEQITSISSFFTILKLEKAIETYEPIGSFDLIYFDAFDPAVQPSLWTEKIFAKMYHLLVPGGTLVTYSSKGEVRRSLKAVGFNVSKLPGPPGKREITRAVRIV
ncbi:MAG: tRNA (5-methylaminomethyl-2-thiouridine)(34)-methyltransferase MnmD [Candidatus Dadabacteria bacterium]